MKLAATATRARTVKVRGRRLRRLSVHSALNSSLWFFFITMERRKGEMSATVSTPVMPLAHQCSSHPGSSRRMNGRKVVSMTAVTAAESME